MPRIKKDQSTSEAKPSDVVRDVLDDSGISLRAMGTSKKASLAGLSLSQFLEEEAVPALPFESPLLQYTFASTGINTGTALEIIGEDGIGKTTMALSLVGMGLRNHPYAVALYLNSEGKNKLFSEDRIASCLSLNKQEAKDMIANRVRWSEVATLNHALESILNFGRVVRENLDKRGISRNDSPIFVVLDTLSKLMPKNEAALLGLGDKSSNPAINSLEDTSNLEFARTLQRWSRAMAYSFEEYGICLILVSHQNTKIEMNTFAARFLSQAALKEDNRTKIGGNALNQSVTLQFTLTKGKILTRETSTSKTPIGQIVKLKVVKNSLSIPHRDCLYVLNIDHSFDTEEEWDQPLKFDYGLPEMFIKERLYGLKVASVQKDTFTSKALNIDSAPRQDVISALKPLISDVLDELNIRGHDRIQDIQDVDIEEEQVLEGDESEVNTPEGSQETEETFDDISDAIGPSLDEESAEEITLNTEVTPKKRGRKPKVKKDKDDERDL